MAKEPSLTVAEEQRLLRKSAYQRYHFVVHQGIHAHDARRRLELTARFGKLHEISVHQPIVLRLAGEALPFSIRRLSNENLANGLSEPLTRPGPPMSCSSTSPETRDRRKSRGDVGSAEEP